MRKYIEQYVCKGGEPVENESDYFVFWNNNPHGMKGYSDQLFQIIKAFRPDLTDEDIVRLIIDDLIEHGLALPDSHTLRRLFKKHLKVTETKESDKLLDFIEKNRNNGWMIIRMKNQVELFNQKIYGHYPIDLETPVNGYFKMEVAPCLK